MSATKIYVIMVMERIEDVGTFYPDLGSTRCWGYFTNKEVAVEALHANQTDMNEGLYEYAVVEGIEEGICSFSDDRQFFKWDENKEGFFEIDEPECLKHICNLTLG